MADDSSHLQDFDLCVVGAGTAGFGAASNARELGARVALVDGPNELGGTCILRGCMPAKTVLLATETAQRVEEASSLGVRTAGARPDPRAIVGRKRHLVEEFRDDRLHDLERFPLFRGETRFLERDLLAVGDRRIRARAFIVATGSVIDPPPIPGLAEQGFMTSDDALEVTQVPPRLLVIGGGPVGCEFAQYFQRLGSEVTLVQDARTLLMKEDREIGDAVAGALRSEGVRVICSAIVERVEAAKPTGDGGGRAKAVRVRVDAARRGGEAAHDGDARPGGVGLDAAGDGRSAAGVETIEVDAVMLATGRRPNVDDLGLERAGVVHDRSGVRVDAELRTSNPAIFAAGDVIGRRCLVHTAERGGRIAARNAICGEPPATLDFDLWESRSVYTHPEVAVAGLNERECRRRGIAYETASYPFSEHGKAVTANLPDGFVKLIAACDGGRILGGAFVGGEATDLVHEVTTLLAFRATVRDVLEVPYLHPTMGEIIAYPAEELCKRLGLHLAVSYARR